MILRIGVTGQHFGLSTQVAVEFGRAVTDEAVGIDARTRGGEVTVPWLEVLATRAV